MCLIPTVVIFVGICDLLWNYLYCFIANVVTQIISTHFHSNHSKVIWKLLLPIRVLRGGCRDHFLPGHIRRTIKPSNSSWLSMIFDLTLVGCHYWIRLTAVVIVCWGGFQKWNYATYAEKGGRLMLVDGAHSLCVKDILLTKSVCVD